MPSTLAFPTAEGFGAVTNGGRGGVVIQVTNLNDSGVGSFRWAALFAGPRIIVFLVAGIINHVSPLKIVYPFITIAGQTAPGEGITFSGEEVRFQTHDIIGRYLRIRTGDVEAPDDGWDNRDAANLGQPSDVSPGPCNTYNVILDHCSLSWAVDETLTAWYGAHDITYQYCLFSEALMNSNHPKGAHSMGVLWGSVLQAFPVYNVTAINCVFISCNERMPQASFCDMVTLQNCLIYNVGDGGFEIEKDGTKRINCVNCHWVRGPSTGTRTGAVVITTSGTSAAKRTQLFIDGCTDWAHPDPTVNNWPMVHNLGDVPIPDGGMNADGIPYHALTRFPTPPITERTMDWVKNVLPQLVGATRPYRDQVDMRVIGTYFTNTGALIDSPSQVGGWPPMDPGTPPIDTDADGMPDYWEDQKGLNKTDPSDAWGDRDGDGYPNLEEYLNELAGGAQITESGATEITPLTRVQFSGVDSTDLENNDGVTNGAEYSWDFDSVGNPGAFVEKSFHTSWR